jgi:23S rRNA A2030 N6-methylase RlmJ
MNYRHAFHAGNHADVLKHIVMARIMAGLGARTNKPFRVFDAHAGIGFMRWMVGGAKQKTGEWQAWHCEDAGRRLRRRVEGAAGALSPRVLAVAFKSGRRLHELSRVRRK